MDWGVVAAIAAPSLVALITSIRTYRIVKGYRELCLGALGVMAVQGQIISALWGQRTNEGAPDDQLPN